MHAGWGWAVVFVILVGLLAKHFYGITHVVEGMERSSQQYGGAYSKVKEDNTRLEPNAGEGDGIGPPSMGTKAVQSDHFQSLAEVYAASRRNMAPYREQVLEVLVASAKESGTGDVKLLGPVLKGLVRAVEKIDTSYGGDFRYRSEHSHFKYRFLRTGHQHLRLFGVA